MNRTRWLLLIAAAGIALFAISFVQGWIHQEREVRGEGFRFVEISLSAWRGAAIPVSALGSIVALLVGLLAAASALGRFARPGWVLLAGSAVVTAFVGASAWPVVQAGHASTVRLSVGWLLPVALILAIVMLVGAVVVARPSGRVLASTAALLVVVAVAGAAGRWFGLQLAEGTGRHWEVGSYARPATEGEPAEVMALDGETYVIGDRWSGSFESSGWTVVFDDDPACPDARGTYHAHGVNDEDLRFVMVVDPCLDGARAADLQTGIWERQP